MIGACANLNDVKTRSIIISRQGSNGGKACPTKSQEHEVCCVVNCVSTWNAWSACDQTTSKKIRTAAVTRPASGGGTACPADEEQTCVPPPLEPADCSTIKDPNSFCANYGNGDLIESASVTSCASSQCTMFSDAARCCQPIANAAKCNSILPENVTEFCQDFGNGLIDNAVKSSCTTSTCNPFADANTCCKSGRYILR